jgi:hypothetical protein
VAAGLPVAGVGRHQALLYGEDEKLGGADRPGAGGLGPADPVLE